MDFTDLIKGIGEKIGMPDIDTTNGFVALNVDDMIINIQHIMEVNQIVTYAEIADRPPDDDGLLAEVLLQSNYMFRGTGGGTISQDPESKKYYFMRMDNLDIANVDTYFADLEKFVDYLQTWRNLVRDYRPAARPTASDPTDAAPLDPFNPGGFMRI